MNEQQNKILVLGLGNDIMGDDAAGLVAARKLRELFKDGVDIFEIATAGFGLIDVLEGYDKALILDSIVSQKGQPGDIIEMTKDELSKCTTWSPHYSGLPELITLAKKLNIVFPKEIRILGLEIGEHGVIREGLSIDIENHIPPFVERAGKLLNEWLNSVKGEISEGSYAEAQ